MKQECKYNSTTQVAQLIAHARRERCMFIINTTEVNTAMHAMGFKAKSDIELWHKEGWPRKPWQTPIYANESSCARLLPRLTPKNPDNVCEACQLDKKRKHAFPSKRNVSKGLLDVIHTDVWGPAQNETIGRCNYFITFIGNYLQHTWICPMKLRSEVYSHFLK